MITITLFFLDGTSEGITMSGDTSTEDINLIFRNGRRYVTTERIPDSIFSQEVTKVIDRFDIEKY